MARLPGPFEGSRGGTFLHRGPIKYHGGPFTGISERYLNGGSGNGASSMGALLGELGRGSFIKDPEY